MTRFSARALLAEARSLTFTPVVDDANTQDKDFLAMFRQSKKDAETTKRLSALEEHWSTDAKKDCARAVELAGQAAALAK